jgi:hypothetical protein
MVYGLRGFVEGAGGVLDGVREGLCSGVIAIGYVHWSRFVGAVASLLMALGAPAQVLGDLLQRFNPHSSTVQRSRDDGRATWLRSSSRLSDGGTCDLRPRTGRASSSATSAT